MTMSIFSRRRLLKAAATTAGAMAMNKWDVLSAMADSEGCPQVSGKVIRWIVPGEPGGSFDVYSRLIAFFYERRIGANIRIDYRPGAGTILGPKVLKESKPDGLTLGILSAPTLLVTALIEEIEAPHPVKDFTILGRIYRNQHVWATGKNSSLHTIDDIFSGAEKKRILFGITRVGTIPFVNIVVTSSLLGIEADFVPGYDGNTGAELAALRGEVDVLVYTFESLMKRIEAGDLRPLLQVSDERISPHPSLDGVPLLGGDNGLASRRASELGLDAKGAKADASALAHLIGAGRLVAAPLGLEESLFRCLEQKLYETLTDPGFKAAAATARRALDVARADVTIAELQAVTKTAEKFIPIVREAIKKAQR